MAQICNDIYSITPGQQVGCDFTTARYNIIFSNLGNPQNPLTETPVIKDNESGSFNFICIGITNHGCPILLADRIIRYREGSLSSFGTKYNKIIIDNQIDAYFGYPSELMYKNAISNPAIDELKNIDSSMWNLQYETWLSDIVSVDSDGYKTYKVAGGKTKDEIHSLSERATKDGDYEVGARPYLVILPKKKQYPTPDIPDYIEVVNSISEIEPGKAIKVDYTGSGHFANLGNKSNKPLMGLVPNSKPDGSLYLVCVGYSPEGYPKLVCDRLIENLTAFNSKWISPKGVSITIDEEPFRIRFMNTISTDQISIKDGKYGEYDALFHVYTTGNGKLKPNSNDIWHFNECRTITTAFRDINTDYECYFYARGGNGDETIPRTDVAESQSFINQTHYNIKNNAIEGIRPVLEYIKPTSNSRGRVGTIVPLYKDKALPNTMIPCSYKVTTESTIGKFFSLGKSSGLPPILAEGEPLPNGEFYFICVGYSPQGNLKFVADRVIQTNISYETLYNAEFTSPTGAKVVIDNTTTYIRLLSSITDDTVNASNYGEYDAIITLHPIGPSDPKIWNCHTKCWTSVLSHEYPSNGELDYWDAIVRGDQDTTTNLANSIKQGRFRYRYKSKSIGFRPVMIVPAEKRDKFGTCIAYQSGSSLYVQLNKWG